MNCLFHLLLLPVYCFVIIFSLSIYFIYLFFNIIIFVVNTIIGFFTKKKYTYTYNKPNFEFKKVIVTNNDFMRKEKHDTKKTRGRIIDVEVDED